MTDRELIALAIKARKNAYIPYSHYAVGAALIAGSGKVYTGCNIENAAYGPTNCAERTAIFKAVSEGEREVKVLAVVAAPESQDSPFGSYALPCGVCRQVMSEFAADDMRVLLAKSEDDYLDMSIDEILPLRFSAKEL
ncbi:MAG: cytidine deaminase [Oscillospiraceae bacterium]|nr:cytidine deaminase [Oscillospiraceae bacterium]